MKQISRRRFIAISAAAATMPATARAGDLYHWQGIALGAQASITLSHPDAERIVARARSEIARLEKIFSLFAPDSALARLNQNGRLENPPFELLECLGTCGAVNAATQGAFDPTVQPLWALYARRIGAGALPDGAEIEAVLPLVGWENVTISSDEIRFARAGMALTLNGIAQGYVADRVSALLRREGLSDVLVNTGEFRAIGAMPGDARGWPISLRSGDEILPETLRLRNMALASSAPLGTVLDEAGRIGHVLNPTTGRPAPTRWQLVTITAPSAAVADGLSTAGCLLTKEQLGTAVSKFPGAAITHLA